VRLLRPNQGLYATSSGLHLRSSRDRRHAPGVRLLRPSLGLHATSSGLHLRSNRDRRHAPGVLLLRPNLGLTPHQVDFIFGQIGTDATLQACVYSGQIGALRRIKRTSPSVTTISDRLGSGALNAVRAHAVTYPTEGHLEDYAPQGGSIASTTLRKHAQKEKIWAQRVEGTLTYITRQKQDTRGCLIKNLTLRGSGREPRNLPREEKSASPLLNVHMLQTPEHKGTATTQTTLAAHGDFRRSISEACPHSKCKALLHRSTDAT
jgi:hypothetical protein